MTTVMRIAMRTIESRIRIAGYTSVERTLRDSAITVFWYFRYRRSTLSISPDFSPALSDVE